jgi:hypothetical protein
MNLILARSKTFSNANQTCGVLFNEQLDELCKTLELPWRDNERGKSCIPAGTYEVIVHKSPKFGQCFWVRGVPGRLEILIHPANFTRQLRGCIAPGLDFDDIDNDGTIDVKSSRKAMDKLLLTLSNKFTLTVAWT